MKLPNHICHLSLLNPALHSRIFYKLALSQRDLGYKVTIMGQSDKLTSFYHEGVQIIPFRAFHRLSPLRFLLPMYILFRSMKLQAHIYTIHTPELLWIGWVLSLLGKKIIYDVHEDYRANIQAAEYYPHWIKNTLAKGVRKVEKLMLPYLSAVSYAELCYENILAAENHQYVVLRNSFSPRAIIGTASVELPGRPYMLYTGTLATAWGIFDTLACWKEMNTHQPLLLIVAGHTHHASLVEKIWDFVKKTQLEAHFQLVGGCTYVPYVDIVELIRHCIFLTALYHINPHLQFKIPTKFYEAMAFDKPLLYTDHEYWNEINQQKKIGIPYRKEMPVDSIWDQLNNWNVHHEEADYHWREDAKKMEKMLSKITT